MLASLSLASILTALAAAALFTEMIARAVEALYRRTPAELLTFPEHIAQRGRWRRPLLFAGLSFSLFQAASAPTLLLQIKGAVAAVFLLAITCTDWEQHVIFDAMLLPFAAAALPYTLLSSLSQTNFAIAAIGGGALFLLISILTRGGIGGGDVKLIFVLGLWLGTGGLIIVVTVGFLLGGAAALIALFVYGKGRGDFIAYGPYFALPALLLLLHGAAS